MDEFEKLLSESKAALERLVRFKISNSYDAEDIIQDICLNALQKFNTLKNKSCFKAWIISIAKNKCNDYYREKAKSMEIDIDALSETELSHGSCQVTERVTVSETLDRLGNRDRQLLYLYFFRELSQKEIAKRLDIPVGTVKSRLYYAKEKFRENYPYPPKTKGEKTMKKFPDIMPEYKIEALDQPAFPVVFEELPNWQIIPRVGEETEWASYDLPTRKLTERVHSKVVAPAFIHGVEGVEIVSKEHGKTEEHIYYAQLTDTHCRWLGESYIDRNGARRLLTFLDGDEFISEWGYGEDNIGNETHLSPSGLIKRSGNELTISRKTHIMDIVGRYRVTLNNTEYDTVCAIEYFENGVLTEVFIDKSGRTVLWRRFNKDDWAFARYQKTWSQMLPDSETLTVDGKTYIHWYDCISDYVVK